MPAGVCRKMDARTDQLEIDVRQRADFQAQAFMLSIGQPFTFASFSSPISERKYLNIIALSLDQTMISDSGLIIALSSKNILREDNRLGIVIVTGNGNVQLVNVFPVNIKSSGDSISAKKMHVAICCRT